MVYATWVLAGATVVLVFVQLWFMWRQLQDAKLVAHERKLAAQVSLGLQLYNDFDSPVMSGVRAVVASAILRGAKEALLPNHTKSILDRLEGVAGFTRRGLLDRKLASFDFTYAVRCYWHEFADYVREQRKKRNDPTFYEDLEWLYGELVKEEAARLGRGVSEAVPTEDEIKAFFISETDSSGLIHAAAAARNKESGA